MFYYKSLHGCLGSQWSIALSRTRSNGNDFDTYRLLAARGAAQRPRPIGIDVSVVERRRCRLQLRVPFALMVSSFSPLSFEI